MRRLFVLAVLLGAIIGAFFMPQAALAGDKEAVEGVLSTYHSPLPTWTILAFKQSHPSFDIAGYLSVMFAESSLGTTGTRANPGNIKWCGWIAPTDDRVWLRWMNGYRGSYGTYASVYWGQRAAIRLIYDRGYMAPLAANDWWGFANRYYGRGIPGIGGYVTNLRAAHAILVREAAKYGAKW